MTLYKVTTAQTVYETYLVEATSEDEARQAITASATRAEYQSYADGNSADEEVIAVREVDAPAETAA